MAVVVTHADQVLFGHRPLPDGGFEWQLPGGWIEPGESPAAAARREVLEETGLTLREARFVGITSNVFSAETHSISLYFEAECVPGGSLDTVSEAGHGWYWRHWSDMDDNLFLPLRLFRATGYRPFASRDLGTCVSL